MHYVLHMMSELGLSLCLAVTGRSMFSYSNNMGNVYVARATSVLLWHIVVNGAVVMFGTGFAPFTPEALLFDMRLLGSTLAFTALIDITQRLTQQLRQSQV